VNVYELFSVGMVILLGLLGGKVAHRFNVPRVSGYLLTGLLLGPSVAGWISSATLDNIHILSEVALGLILFAIGGEIEISHFKSMGRRAVLIGLAECLGAFLLVFSVSALITGDAPLAAILGTISMATAPGVTLLIIREYRASGPLTDMLLAAVAINNVVALVSFRLVISVYSLAQGDPVTTTLWLLAKELAFSALIGGAVAALITLWEQTIDDLSELLLVIVGGLLLGIGLARTLGISPLLICLIIGAVTNNLSMMHRLVYAELRQTEMPFYIAFFVLSGASLHLESLASLGLLGVAYLFMRPAGKILGSRLAAARLGALPSVRKYLGFSLTPHGSVAIGLSLSVSRSHPEIGGMVATVILSTVIVSEAVGPFIAKTALAKAGELNPED
jgi:Kef-type K+ transport system membrane component KefB